MYNPIRLVRLTKPVYLGICFGLICLWSSNTRGQIIYSKSVLITPPPPTQAADLQVKQMTYSSSNCTMNFQVYNNGTYWSAKTSIWSGYQSAAAPYKFRAIEVPAIAVKALAWISQPMWEVSASGQKTCGMKGVVTVRSYVNARYPYKYSNGVYTIGFLLPVGSSAPAGWYLVEPTAELNQTNNELTFAVPYTYTTVAPTKY